MSTINGGFTIRNVAVGAVLACWIGVPAWASIDRISATISTIVQERIDSVPASVSSDRQTLGVDAPEPPLGVSASLTSTDLNGVLVSLGQGFGDFADPARLGQANPEELGAEVACYSHAESVSYSVRSSAVEARTVMFSDIEIDFASDGTQTVESRVFLSGAILFWSTQPERNLGEMLAELSVSVTRDDTDSPVFETNLLITGASDAQVQVASTGPIRSEVVGLDALADQGADAESISILERVGEDGTLTIVLIPPQEHTYSYVVTADEPFDLTVTLETRARNIPGGTGVAAVVGRPFGNLADFIELGLPGVDGLTVQRALNEATAKRALGLVRAASSSPRRSASPLCGAFGLEAGALLVLGLLVAPGVCRARSIRAA